MSECEVFRSGYVAIVGRPNVGKSTLLNRFLQQKISITSRRPQTTRHNILGINTLPCAQIVYVDTPGLHRDGKRAINRYMNKAATSSLVDVDVVLFVVEALRWTSEDQMVLERVSQCGLPCILVVNKVDLSKDKSRLLPYLDELSKKMEFTSLYLVSARKGKQIPELEAAITQLLPEGEAFFAEDQVTNRSSRFLVAELIREKLMRRYSRELPYSVTVEIEQFKEEGALVRLHTIIWVERKGQKKILIGTNGEGLKEVGRQAREDIEKLLDKKVYLEMWVKVKEGWADDERALQSLGYSDGA